MKRLIISAAAFCAACSPAARTATSEPSAVEKVKRGEVGLVAIAPDGTQLWAVEPEGGRTIYFASAGAQTSHSESCGKNCTRTLDDVVATAVAP